MKLKGLFMSAAMLAPMAIAPMSAFADEQPATDTSKVTAEVKSGGMAVTAANADFGALTIGTDPTTTNITDFLTVKDHTGGAGYEVNVKATNYDSTKDTLATTATIGEKSVDLTSTAGLINEGESQLAVQKFNGSVSGKWGATPKAGAFSQDLQWTMTAKATPTPEATQADNFREAVVVNPKIVNVGVAGRQGLTSNGSDFSGVFQTENSAEFKFDKASNKMKADVKVDVLDSNAEAVKDLAKYQISHFSFIRAYDNTGGEFKVVNMSVEGIKLKKTSDNLYDIDEKGQNGLVDVKDGVATKQMNLKFEDGSVMPVEFSLHFVAK